MTKRQLTEAQREAKRERDRQFRAKLKAAGRCVNCASRVAAPGRTRCQACLDAHADIQRARIAERRAAGLCQDCPAPARPGRVKCEACAAGDRARSKKRAKQNKAAGRCTMCTVRLTAAERAKKHTLCAPCRYRLRVAQAERRIQRIQQGLCLACGKPHTEHTQRCRSCTAKQNAYVNAYMRKRALQKNVV